MAYFDTRLLTTGVLGGVLADRAGVPVNFVNAEGVAAELGVTASETRESGIPDFPRLITVAVAGSGGAMSVSGTSLGSEHKPRLVRVFGEDVDIEPAPHMAFLRYVDAPGIGGKVGTLLGEWGVNIGHMSVGRGKLGDEAVMALTLDESLTRAADGGPGRPLRPRVRAGGRAVDARRRAKPTERRDARKTARPPPPARSSARRCAQAALRMTSATSLEIARMLPSLSLNQPVLRSPDRGDAVHRLESREVVLLELDALAAQLAHGALHVLAEEARVGGLAAAVGALVEKQPVRVADIDEGAVHVALESPYREAERVAVEPDGPVQIVYRDRGHDR